MRRVSQQLQHKVADLFCRALISNQKLASKMVYQANFLNPHVLHLAATQQVANSYVALSQLCEEETPLPGRLYPEASICLLPRPAGGIGLSDLTAHAAAMRAKPCWSLYRHVTHPWADIFRHEVGLVTHQTRGLVVQAAAARPAGAGASAAAGITTGAGSPTAASVGTSAAAGLGTAAGPPAVSTVGTSAAARMEPAEGGSARPKEVGTSAAAGTGVPVGEPAGPSVVGTSAAAGNRAGASVMTAIPPAALSATADMEEEGLPPGYHWMVTRPAAGRRYLERIATPSYRDSVKAFLDLNIQRIRLLEDQDHFSRSTTARGPAPAFVPLPSPHLRLAPGCV
jgi:hypothetical protein